MSNIQNRSLSEQATNNHSNTEEDPNPELSEYEKSRARNIERNNARLRLLGLISALEETQSNARAWGLGVPQNAAIKNTNSCSKEQKGPVTKKRKLKNQVCRSPARKSSRLQGLESVDTVALHAKPISHEERSNQRKARVRECREARQLAALRVMEAGEEKAAKENPTATYEHCLIRVRTMTEKGLQNRVKAIERAAGKHCVVKMAIFKSCLQDEDMWDLAELASKALERLKALQAPPNE